MKLFKYDSPKFELILLPSIWFLNNLFNERKKQVLMQEKLIAVVYTLRTYWKQFSLGGICKQE